MSARINSALERLQAPPDRFMLLVLAEDDNGDLYLPCLGLRSRLHRHRNHWWDRPFSWHKPWHWPYAAATWVTGWVVPIEPRFERGPVDVDAARERAAGAL